MSDSNEDITAPGSAWLGSVELRRPIGVAGPDRASWLQGLLTNDIEALTPGDGCYAAWLTPQGRMLTDLHVLEAGDMMLLDLPAAQHASTLERLDQFLFAENVQVQDLGDAMESVWVHGPGAPGAVERAEGAVQGLESWPQYHNRRVAISGAAVVVARIDQLGVPGFCLYSSRTDAAGVRAALTAAGAVSAPEGAIEAARIAAGLPVFGVDMTSETIPLEAGIESRAISFTKGCYVGQEVVIRVLHRGHGRVARKLVSLTLEAGVPAAGARMFAGDRDAGRVTSAARSGRRGPVALGYLHRDFLAVGTVVDVEMDGERYPARVERVAGSDAS